MSLLIVTVVKNDLGGLRRTEASIRRQTFRPNWLVVTPLDSSMTSEHVSNLNQEGLITRLIPDLGRGIYPAMNLAIQESPRNEWLWFLNAGDEFAADNSAELVLKYIKESKMKWLYGGNKLTSSYGDILGEVRSPLSFDPRNQLFAKKFVSHQSTVFENSFLNELGGFREHLKIAADWDLMVRASKINIGQRIEETISVFYLGGLSTLSRRTSNYELLVLRKEHLHDLCFLKSYIWFAYREIRNFFVQLFEHKFSVTANKIRRLRLELQSRFHH